jgi:hypothetical protein
MAKVNANDRATLEQAYPADGFATDAARNEAPGVVQRGLRIGSAPDTTGDFELERASRHAGEPETPTFLVPSRGQEYGQFLDDVVAAARRHGYHAETSPGQGDARIKGLRQ